ncbi:MAG: hypothetical protein QXV22_04940, partial [Thermoplasmataceae archaeon]
SWFLYNGSSSMFVVIPLALVIGIYFGRPLYSLLTVIWGLAYIVLGFSLGVLIDTAFSGRKSRRSFRKGTELIRNIGLISVFILFYLALQFITRIPDLPPIQNFPLLYLAPVINSSYLGIPLENNTLQAVISVLGTLIEFSLIALLYSKSVAKSYSILAYGSEPSSGNGYNGGLKMDKGGKYSVTFKKEIRNIFRKSQYSAMMLIPVFIVLPTVLSVFFYAPVGSLQTTYLYFSFLAIVTVSSSFYSLVLVISEAGSIGILQSLPIRMKDIVYTKSYVGLVVFSAIMIPLSLLLMTKSDSQLDMYLLVPVNFLVAYAYTSLRNLNWLMNRVPRGATTINFYSFGGNLAVVMLFLISGALISGPVMVASLLSFLSGHILRFGGVFFYLVNLLLGLVVLYVYIKRVG